MPGAEDGPARREPGELDDPRPRTPDSSLVAEACRILGELDLTRFSLGHVSVRTGPDTMLIKGKGPAERGLRFAGPEDVIEVDFRAEVIDGAPGLRAPSESFIHIWMYRTRPEVRSVVHVHPEAVALLTICGHELRPIYGSYGLGAQLAIEGVPVYPRSVRIDSDELGAELAEAIGDKRALLMRGHGVTVVGDSVEDAVVRTIYLDELATMTYKALLLGGAADLPPQDLAELARPFESDRPRGSAGGRAGVLAAYAYYRRLAERRR